MSRFEHLDKLLARFVESGAGPAGCASMVARHGKILYEGYHGYANLEARTPITPDTVYRLYSMTKVIICTAALMLYERGHFLLHDPLHAYIPEFRDALVYRKTPEGEYYVDRASRPILIRDAFTMSVGYPLPFWSETPTARELARLMDPTQSQGEDADLNSLIKAVARVPMEFDPGDRWMYGLGHDLVAALVEAVSGKTIGQFLQEEIFEPLGMKDTGYRYRGNIQERMATVYEFGEDGSRKATIPTFDILHHPNARFEGGGFGLYSTASDYLKFAQMLANGGVHEGHRLIGRKTIDLMRTNHLDEAKLQQYRSSPYHAGYGYGLGVRTLMDKAAAGSNSSIGEFGWSGMAGTWTSIDPDEGLSIVYMHQTFPHMEEYHHLRVRAAVYGCL